MIIFYMTGMKRMQDTDFMDLSMPAERCRNARKDFKLTIREENIILRHMFPLNVVPPMCKEHGWYASPIRYVHPKRLWPEEYIEKGNSRDERYG